MISSTLNDTADDTGGNKDSDTKLVVPTNTINDLTTIQSMTPTNSTTVQSGEQLEQNKYLESNRKLLNDKTNDTMNVTEKIIADSSAVMHSSSNAESREGFTLKYNENGNEKDDFLIKHNNELNITENQELNERTSLPVDESSGTISKEITMSGDSLYFDKSKDAIEKKACNTKIFSDKVVDGTNTSEFLNNPIEKPTDLSESSSSANINTCTQNSTKFSLNSKKSRLHIYVMRDIEPKEVFNMEVVFSKSSTFPMVSTPINAYTRKPGPFIYSIQLDLTQAPDGCWFCPNESSCNRCDSFYIRIKQTSLKVTKWHYDDQQKHSTNILAETSHLFILDSHFNKSYGTHAPGSQIPILRQLSLYTSHILNKHLYGTFDTLAKQVEDFLKRSNCSIDNQQVNDFLEMCCQYLLPTLLHASSRDRVVITIIVRMIGLLKIERHTLDENSELLKLFANNTLSCVSKYLNDLIDSLKPSECDQFENGLALLLCVQLATRISIEPHSKRDHSFGIELLQSISNEVQRRKIIDKTVSYIKLLRWIMKLETKTWGSLLMLVRLDYYSFTNLNQCTSFKEYFEILMKIVPVLAQKETFEHNLEQNFQHKMQRNVFPITFESIIYLDTFLKEKLSGNDEFMEKSLKTIHLAIESNHLLSTQIEKFMGSVRIDDRNFDVICSILQRIPSSTILYSIDRKQIILESLKSSYCQKTDAFYMKWFNSFLVPHQEQHLLTTESDFNYCLTIWLSSCIRSYDQLVRLLSGIDQIIDDFHQHPYLICFLNHVNDLCFQEDTRTFQLLVDVLGNIRTTSFLDEFKKRFIHLIIMPAKQDLKRMEKVNNPLLKLVEIYEKPNRQQKLNEIVCGLIKLTCDQIDITDDVIKQNTFIQPNSQSLVYKVLFKGCFKETKIYQKTTDWMLCQWILWGEKKEFKIQDIYEYKDHTKEQREVFNRIWKFISNMSQKNFDFDMLINEQEKQIEDFTRNINDILTCLKMYCHNGSDINYYIDLLDQIQKSIQAQIIRNVSLSEDLQKLLPLAQKLNPYSKSKTWKVFVQDYSKLAKSTTGNLDQEITTDCNVDVPHQIHCLDELERIKALFDIFDVELKRISAQWDHLPISQIIALFPELQFIDDDFLTLKSLFNDSAIPSLEKILNYWKHHQRINEMCQSIIKLLKYLNLTNDNDGSSITERMLKLNEETPGEICCKTYNEYCTSYFKKYSNETLDFIEKFNASTELLEFIRPLTSIDIESLLESINDSDETLIDAPTIINLTKIKSFFEHINQEVETIRKQISTSVPHDIIIKCLENLLNKTEFKNIVSYIDSGLNSLTSIQRLYMELTNKGLSKRQRILEIMQTSQLAFLEQRENIYGNIEHQFNVKITIKEQTLSTINHKSTVTKENIKERSITYVDLHELRDRARLIEYSTNKVKEDSEDQLDKLRSFIEMVDLIETILKDLTSLNLTGHPSILEYLEPKRLFRCDAGHFDELKVMSSQLNQILTDWNNYLCEKYKDYVCLTYFSHQQIWWVEDYLYEDESESTKYFGYHFMKFIDIDIPSIQTNLLQKKAVKPEERLQNIARILNDVQIATPIGFSNESNMNKTIYLVSTTDESILRSILSIFELNKMQPKMNHLFYCTPTTSWIEIRAFVYRCFYSKKSLHQLIRPDLLSLSIQDQFTHLIRDLIKSDPERSFHLGIVTTASTDQLQLINGLKVLKIDQTVADHELLDEEKMKNEIEKLIGENCQMVTSDIVGLGKSTYIRDKIQELKKEYIKITINGNFDADTITERLTKITAKLSSSQAAIHLDIGIMDNVQQFNEFLYCLLMFRAFRSGRMAVTIPADIPIFIEFDSSYSSSRITSKAVVLRYLPKHHIDHIDWNQLKIENRWSTLFVVQYLKAIQDQTISSQNIQRDTNQLKDLTVEQCITHLKNQFDTGKNNELATWTQLNIYTSIYDTIFSGFSLCGHFMVFIFNDKDEQKSQLRIQIFDDEQEQIQKAQLRIHILQTLLDSSSQFTSLSVRNVRNKQRSLDITDTSLSDAIVRWDKTDPFTVVFSDTYDPLFIYKAINDIPESLRIEFQRCNRIERRATQGTHTRQDLFRLRRSRLSGLDRQQHNTQTQELLPDYSKLKHEELFLKLASLSKKYYRRPICRKCFKQYESTVKHCQSCPAKDQLYWAHELKTNQMESLIKDIGNNLGTHYVLTPDNYIKMLLIYLRIQSNIPVLIMGETGIDLYITAMS
ncbi:unnamed protein product [Rotaria socialis]